MNIHEYQAKELLKSCGGVVPDGAPAFSVEEAVRQAEKLGKPPYVVKAQIHAGGRGKGGGVRIVHSTEEVREAAQNMLGMQLVTHQTGEAGKKVERLYVEQGCAIADELYLSFLLDRVTSRVTVIASTEGGVEIEQVAEDSPEKINRVSIDPATGIMPFHARKLAFGLGLSGDAFKAGVKFIMSAYKAYTEMDASLLEVNPLVRTEDDQIMVLDAKMTFDDNALYRQQSVADMRDGSEENEKEREAHKHDLAYIPLDGNIGCMVNGAGLAMATMDIIKLNGGAPANFLDVGGGASEEKVTAAFRIIMDDPQVKGILVNIFGGIMKCDVIAQGIIAAAEQVALNVPLVVRLEGTNVEDGKRILEESGLPIIAAEDLGDAAAKIVKETGENRVA